MKLKFTLALLICCSIHLSAQLQTFYDFAWPTIDEDTISMSQYAGKKVMVVNCASYCHYTPQYTPLNALDSLYAARYNFAIIGYPSDDFGHQGGTDSAIVSTCQSYHVRFQIMSTVKINNGDTAPLYKWLQRGDLNGEASHAVSWNFNKYLIDRQGHWVRWFDSSTDPLDTAITKWIIEDSAAVSPSGITSSGASADNISIQSANPAATDIAILVETSSDQRVDINLYSVDGRLISAVYSGHISASRQVRYPVATLPSGVYYIRAHSEAIDRTIKAVIQH